MTIRNLLWFLIGLGLSGAIRDYYGGGRSLSDLVIVDFGFVAVGLIGLAIIMWRRQD